VPFYRPVDEHGSALVEEIRHAFTISFHKERGDRLSSEGWRGGRGLRRATGAGDGSDLRGQSYCACAAQRTSVPTAERKWTA